MVSRHVASDSAVVAIAPGQFGMRVVCIHSLHRAALVKSFNQNSPQPETESLFENSQTRMNRDNCDGRAIPKGGPLRSLGVSDASEPAVGAIFARSPRGTMLAA